jgi:hypothetical protein
LSYSRTAIYGTRLFEPIGLSFLPPSWPVGRKILDAKRTRGRSIRSTHPEHSLQLRRNPRLSLSRTLLRSSAHRTDVLAAATPY